MTAQDYDGKRVKQELARRGEPVEEFLRGCLKGRHYPCELLQAMEYSLMAGGKRLRPVLCLTAAGMFGADAQAVLPFASALEMIHTYSLVHDDLPALDNDDLRRGKPSNHKKFGEAMAILAGDGLLTESFVFMASVVHNLGAERVLPALAEVAAAAGSAGMVGGQVLDMLYTGSKEPVALPQLRDMHARKTGALITCSCVSGAILAGASEDEVERLRQYGRNVGTAFQIADDILDVVGDEKTLGKPVGSDEGQGKSTYPALMGLDKSRMLAQEHVDQAVEALSGLDNDEALFLAALAQFVVDRVS